jgi:cyanophycin synthetase
MAHGLRQPVMQGTVRVDLPRRPDLAALDRAMARHIFEAATADTSSQEIEVALVQRALHWAAAVQRQVNVPVFQSGHVWHARGSGTQGGELQVAVPYFVPQAAIAALAWVERQVCRFLATAQPAPQERELEQGSFEKLEAALRKFSPAGVNTYRFLKAAHALDMPVRQVVRGVYCFGTGRHSRWLESSCTESTSVIGCRIAKDKVKTAKVLRQAGLPAPRHTRVATPERAVEVANEMGYPVVVKPADKDQGIGVAANLRSDEAVLAAFDEARKHSKNVLVEKHFDGKDYRLMVLNGRVIKAAVRIPGGVIGDGRHTVAQLIELSSEDEQHARRARERGGRLLTLDQEALELLAEDQLSPESVAAPGQYVCLRRRANVSAGGTPVLVDKLVHADNRRLAERAAAALRLDLAGVDLIMEDISRSWLETGALICEVNGQPQIGAGTTPRIYADILRELLPEKFRIPVVLAVGKPDRIGQGSLLPAQITGVSVGSASSEGVRLGDERLTGPQASAYNAGRILMASREIDAALVVMSPAEIRRTGLPFDWCDIALIHSPGDWVESGEALGAEMLRMLLPHAGKIMMTDRDHALVKPHWAALQSHGGLEIVAADEAQTMNALALRRVVRAEGSTGSP